jgi:mono/diheme cytochrome c family protein
VFGGALTGVLLATFISFGTPALYDLMVGGQESTPLPPAAIMYFELIALCTMLATFIGFLLQNRFPILTRQMYDERITDGYIGVQVRTPPALVDDVANVFESFHSHVIKREDAALYPGQGIRPLLFWGGVGTAGLVVMIVPLLLTYDVIRLPWVNTMKDTVSVAAQEGPRRAAPAESVPIQGPVLIAGQPATGPLEATDTSIQRGQMLFGINCAMCHGIAGDQVGAQVGAYFAQGEIPQNLGERAQRLSDEEIFLVITNGKNRMPSLSENLSPGDTWDVINYVRTLSAQVGGTSD